MISKTSKPDENFNLLYPSSHCRLCKKPIPFYNNIPILSYLILRGKCSNCKNQISLQYPIVEIVTALVTLHASRHFNLGYDFFAILLFCYLLISITVIDFNHKIIPDSLSYSLILSGITFSIMFYLQGSEGILTEPISSVLGILFGYFLPFLIYRFHYSYTGKEGMGHGDFKLLAGLGAWLGWKMIPIVLFFAAITGLIYAFFLIASKKIENDKLIPFAPFLSLAGWILMFYAERIMDGYINAFI
jgi:leader peptidase (prepilin peptidase)/N-methyltransferase